MTSRAHDVTERAGALALLLVSVVLAIWSRGRVVEVEADSARREDQLEQLVEWQRAGADHWSQRGFDAHTFAGFFAGADLVVARGVGVDYLRLEPRPSSGPPR